MALLRGPDKKYIDISLCACVFVGGVCCCLACFLLVFVCLFVYFFKKFELFFKQRAMVASTLLRHRQLRPVCTGSQGHGGHWNQGQHTLHFFQSTEKNQCHAYIALLSSVYFQIK